MESCEWRSKVDIIDSSSVRCIMSESEVGCVEDCAVQVDISKAAKLQRSLKWAGFKKVSIFLLLTI